MRFLKILGLLILLSVLGLVGFVYVASRQGMAQYSGTIKVQENPPAEKVSIYRDDFGVPHIEAATEADAYFALGYVHAQERLFEMLSFRLYSQGRLTELAGEGPVEEGNSVLEQDRFFRVVGFKRMGEEGVKNLDPQSLELLQSYTNGVNAYLKTQKKLPPDVWLSGINVDEWKMSDSLSIGRMVAWFLGHNFEREIIRLQAIGELGLERGWELLPRYPDHGPYIIDPSQHKYDPAGKVFEEYPLPVPPEMLEGDFAAALLDMTEKVRIGSMVFDFRSDYGSNSWVVDGSRTQSGKPIMSNDPHLLHMLPSIFFQAHLVTGDGLDVIGVTFPGMPFVALGHNQHVAWGATTTRADTQDMFVEKVDPAKPGEYLHNGEWKKFETREEIFKIKDIEAEGGFREEKLTVRISVHGPILNDVIPEIGENAPPFALAWAGNEPTNDVKGFFALSRTKNAEEMKAALAEMTVPVQNWIYADVDGNIGYFASGLYPIRLKGDGTLPVPGWTGDYDWNGYIPQDEVPQLHNPANGVIITANNAVLPEKDYPYVVSVNYQYHRAARIAELLAQKEKMSTEDMAKYQTDRFSMQGEMLAPVIAEAFEAKGDKSDALAVEAAKILSDWDFFVTKESAAPLIFYKTYIKALEVVYSDDVSSELLYNIMKIDATDPLFDPVLRTGESSFIDNKDTKDQVEDRDDVLALALKLACKEIAAELGEDISQWSWGSVHKMVFAHPVGVSAPILSSFFKVYQIPSDGARETVFPAYFTWVQGNFMSNAGPCFRQVIDMSDVPGAGMVIETGQSGHPASKHFFDQNEKWFNGEFIPMPIGLEAVKKKNQGLLEIVPATGE